MEQHPHTNLYYTGFLIDIILCLTVQYLAYNKKKKIDLSIQIIYNLIKNLLQETTNLLDNSETEKLETMKHKVHETLSNPLTKNPETQTPSNILILEEFTKELLSASTVLEEMNNDTIFK